MSEQKLVIVIMGQECSKFLEMCFESVKESDAIVYIDGGSTPEFWKEYDTIIEKLKIMPEIIHNKYDQKDKGMNGKQRNVYLEYVKNKYPDFWCLVLDADEVVQDINKIKEFIQTAKNGLYSINMRHFHNDLGHEDSTKDKHYVLNRLFKISEADKYLEVEHPVLQGVLKEGIYQNTDCTTIFHLAHIQHCFNIKNRYEKNMKHSNMHSPEYLDQWKDAHILGFYPNKQIDVLEIPDTILKYFNIEKDKYYFKDRGLEVKHFIDANHWKQFFNPKVALEIGCGLGPRVYAMNCIGIISGGIEISEWAVKNSMVPENIRQGDITKTFFGKGQQPDLVIAYDILEHIDYSDIDATIGNLIYTTTKYLLISVPTLGDPNLYKDKDHRIFEDKIWWVNQFVSKGLKQIEVPPHFLYRNQLMIFERTL